ncbi:MAG: hypothetical protein ACXWVS_06250 [Hyphomicrobium sp.]
MSLDIDVQRRYDGVELVTGIGDPGLNRFCIMSFVAFMAGEYFGDRPKTASQIIRKFVIPLNDRVDPATRQRLKPFAPRIIATNDGHDDDRAALIWQTITREILPAALDDAAAGSQGIAWDRHSLGESAASVRLATLGLPARVRRNIEHMLEARERGCHDVLAKEAGHMLATLAETSRQEERRTWYFNQAIALLDRLCEVGVAERTARDRKVRAGKRALEAAPAGR